jgi:hypothetical protein
MRGPPELTRFPPNMSVQIFDAPPPGDTPVTKRPAKKPNVFQEVYRQGAPNVPKRIGASAEGKMNPRA